MRLLPDALRILRCHLIGCLVRRLQRGQGITVCRDCGRRWPAWRPW